MPIIESNTIAVDSGSGINRKGVRLPARCSRILPGAGGRRAVLPLIREIRAARLDRERHCGIR